MKFSEYKINNEDLTKRVFDALGYVVIRKHDGFFYDGNEFTDNLDNAKMVTETLAMLYCKISVLTYRFIGDLWDNVYDERQQYTATVITYDVWGNDTDGYEVNDKHTMGTYDFSTKNYDINNDIDIIDFLQDVYFANPVKLSDIDIDGDIECCYINNAINGKPILEIVFNQV